MVLFPPAKINLGLRVLGKRSDGYHDIETCFYPVSLCDILEGILAAGSETKFSNSGLPIQGNTVENLVTNGYNILNERFRLPPMELHLHKIIPMGAGLGGGSADAAYTLKLINDLFKLDLSKEDIFDFAIQLGSDCAYFLQNNVSMGFGRGEILKPVPVSLKGWHLLLVKPDVHISTSEAFGGLTASKPTEELQTALLKPVEEWKDKITNDFETVVFRKHPVIREIKDKLYSLGATFALMSGSGASVYGLFKEPGSLQYHFPGAFVHEETLTI